MAETGTDAPQPEQQPQVRMNILSQYIKDLSFENILARKPADGNVQPDVKIQVGLDANRRASGENHYEVVIKAKVTSNAKDTDQPLFLLEVEYAGVFLIDGIPQEQLHPFLMIECPRMLFPFLRRIVSDVTRDGGFPPLNLDTIDFVQLYRQEIQRRAQEQQAAAQPN
ncbi:protein-export chaperone SecB [Pseudooceanicola nanhaiensis]|uniref:protein-export chaperone SecB n=1 Tax=Pseudooceanicola nanhaiensis TaxID=375761 RepID=UPI001CD3360F|nr:protein-export chaperone SecB [Pseudooceanicola nanhaiensis]MCA0920266.1 protein-export chaperone SecB [Pseudooceanicola nanhaiensis]